jgi:hypothetical protein
MRNVKRQKLLRQYRRNDNWNKQLSQNTLARKLGDRHGTGPKQPEFRARDHGAAGQGESPSATGQSADGSERVRLTSGMP